jgi:hypothetical protein
MRTLIARNIGPWSEQASCIAAGIVQADIAESFVSAKESHRGFTSLLSRHDVAPGLEIRWQPSSISA